MFDSHNNLLIYLENLGADALVFTVFDIYLTFYVLHFVDYKLHLYIRPSYTLHTKTARNHMGSASRLHLNVILNRNEIKKMSV